MNALEMVTTLAPCIYFVWKSIVAFLYLLICSPMPRGPFIIHLDFVSNNAQGSQKFKHETTLSFVQSLGKLITSGKILRLADLMTENLNEPRQRLTKNKTKMTHCFNISCLIRLQAVTNAYKP